MKKIFALILVLTLALSMSTIAFATDVPGDDQTPTSIPATYEDFKTVDLNKLFKITNSDTTSPGETFSFKIEKVRVTDSQYNDGNMPMFTPAEFTISFAQGEATAAGDTNFATLTLPTYEHVGIFTYKITETASNTAGLTYDGKPMFLKVTVIEQSGKIRIAALHYETENGLKNEKFKNEFSAGNLKIAKVVTGNMGEKDRYFKVAVTLTAPLGKTVADNVSVSGGSNATNPTTVTVGTAADFYLKDGETVTLSNIPYGVTYTVVEEDVTGDGYKAAEYGWSDENKTINSPSDTVTITNNKGTDVDTGINLDNLPYAIILILAVGGLILFAAGKRLAANRK